MASSLTSAMSSISPTVPSTVTPDRNGGSGYKLSAGAIAGIAIGIAALVALLIALCIFLIRTRTLKARVDEGATPCGLTERHRPDTDGFKVEDRRTWSRPPFRITVLAYDASKVYGHHRLDYGDEAPYGVQPETPPYLREQWNRPKRNGAVKPALVVGPDLSRARRDLRKRK